MLQSLVPNVIPCNVNKTFDCSVCPLAKQKRLHFPASISSSSSCFDLIHADIWGPYSTPCLNGSKYFLTLVDDHNRCTWVYFMKHKFETSCLIQSFYNMIFTQFHVPIKILRFDNGPKFTLNSFYAFKGIIHQLSCVETPQQNSVVERKHQHLFTVARALRFQANLPLKFWGDCVLTATYLINRIPSPLLHDLTPFQMLLGKPPSYVHLRSFGCLCYASTLARDRPNLVPRPRLVFFLVILLVLKVTSFMIWLLGHVLSPGMLSSKSLVFLLNIGLLNPLLFQTLQNSLFYHRYCNSS